MNMADRKKAVVFPWQVPYDVVAALKELDFQKILQKPIAYLWESCDILTASGFY